LGCQENEEKRLEHTYMITENRFSNSFTSFWKEVIPLADRYVRMLNLSLERFDTPLDSDSDPSRRDLINEIGFRIFKESLSYKRLLSSRSKPGKHLDEIAAQAWEYIRMFRKQRFRPYYATRDISAPVKSEIAESIVIAKRLQAFFRKVEKGKKATLSPEFPGCGIIDNSEGDIITSQTLYEIKAGERNFRLVDVRQVLVYLALNQSATLYDITSIGLLNPRIGVFVKVKVDDLAMGTSGKSTVGLLSEIIQFASGGEVSR
jgi:hypothetical protein